ncbi:MAG: aldehyde dehydrogenase family protein [archaeon]|nr:aldehyde dehydrogenase family protein [archaeon]
MLSNGEEVSMQLGCFIDNRFVDVVSGQKTTLVNPASEEAVCEVPCGGDAEVEAACQAARRAFEDQSSAEAWSRMPAAERGALLGRLADLLEEERRTVALLEAANVGKPLFESLNFDLHQVIRSFRYFAGFADKYHGVQVPLNPEHLCFTSNLPLGPCALVMPFNFPLQLLCWKLAPALSVGCTIVIKPAEITPLSTLYLARLVRRAGFPPGVVNVVTGKGRDVGMSLISHPLVAKVSFTGSVPVGCTVQQQAAKTGTVPKPVSLELGGKSPIIVFEDVPDFNKCLSDC